MNARLKQGLLGTAVLVVLSIAAIISLCFEGRTGAEQADTRPDASVEQVVKRVTSRTEYIACVDGGVGPSATTGQVAMVGRALDQAFAVFPHIPHRVIAGCQPPRALTGTRLSASAREFGRHARFVTPAEPPSAYVLAVYFVPADVYEASFEAAYPYAVTTEERLCEGDVCRAVTGGLYVTPAVTTEQLRYAFEDLVGLVPKPVDACMGAATPEPVWCGQFWIEVGVTPPPQ